MRRLVVVGAAALAAGGLFAEHEKTIEMMDISDATCGWRSVRVNRSISGGALTVRGQRCWLGLGTHAPSRVVVPLGEGALRVETDVGVDDAPKGGSVIFRIWADDRLMAETPLMKGGDDIRSLKVDLRGAKTCTLEALDGGDGRKGDHADWIKTRFFYEDGKYPPTDVRAHSRQLGILTPPPGPKPRINGARVYGVRPGHPVLWRLPVTGERPMELEAKGLPEGLAFDAATQVLSGSVTRAGDYPITFVAKNAKGRDESVLTVKVGDRISLTPAMGWNSWNCFSSDVSAEKVRAAAEAMLSSGLADHGWSYVNIDDYWTNKPESDDATLQGPARDANGDIVCNGRFPDMKGLVDDIHAKGLKVGIYSSPGTLTCGRCVGSYGHEAQDAKRYADWGFDYLKYDWCWYSEKAFGEGQWRWIHPYWIMGRALRQQSRDILFSLCEYGCENVSAWGNLVHGQSWRTTGDVFDTWPSISMAIEKQRRLFPYSGPGAWNDPDMLCVGKMAWNGFQGSRLAPNEQYTHLSLWALVASPLMIGCDMTKLDAFTYALLSNDEVIAIDQDPLGAGAGVVDAGDDWEIWARPLANGSIAAGLYNKALKEQAIVFDMEKLGLLCKWTVRDVWRQADEGVFLGTYSQSVPGHATHLVIFTPRRCGKLRDGLLDIRDNAWDLLVKQDQATKKND